ncbi:MAG: tetratricopeptide repeat protein [Flavobacteriales bacterium]|nr:tetratricopeptide repeat protein [Flavobacteriales bacterium]MCB9197463.1 tetratricopeptide repeat protein [Flavobacteriales bacterium]
MKRIVLIYLVVLLQALPSYFSAQDEYVDSLKNAFDHANHDTTRCKILNLLIESIYDDSIWPIYNQQLHDFAFEKMSSAKGELKEFYASYYALALNNTGYLYMIKSNHEGAEKYYLEALEMELAFKNKTGIATVYNNLGYLARHQGNIKKAIDYYHDALKIQIEINNKQGIAIAYNNLAYVFDSQEEYEEAMNYYQQSLDLHLEIKDDEGAAIAYGNLAAIYSEIGDPDCKGTQQECLHAGLVISVNYLNKAIELYGTDGNMYLLGDATNHLAGLYDTYGDPLCTNDSASCFVISQKKALELYQKALDIRLNIDDQYGLSQSYASLAKYELKHHQTEIAFQYGKKALSAAELAQAPSLISDAALILKELYEIKHDYQSSLQMYELYIEMKDSIYNEENSKSTLKKTFQINYEIQSAKDSIANVAKIQEEQFKSELKVKQQRYYTYGGLIGFVLMVVVALVSFRAYRNKVRANEVIQQQKQEVEHQKIVIEEQKEIVEEKQKEIVESINYAKRIQEAILPPKSFIDQYIEEYFILYLPKDIVAGDFYWAEKINDLFFIAAADSTGHGVPGALVSVVCSGALHRSVKEFKLTKTGEILDKTRDLVLETFEKSNEEVKDGMDISLLCIDRVNRKVYWSGANNSLCYIENNELKQLNADKQPIGKTENPKPFTTHELPYEEGSGFFLYTDGYADQFGGEKDKKFRLKNLLELIHQTYELPASQQREVLNQTFEDWKGTTEQVDDVCVIGVRI